MRSAPVRRIVVLSLLTGLVPAGVLAVVVFGGAREHVVTGSALLAFAVGWAMLAVWSIRRSEQPQRWAFVPAAAMGVAGAGLLLLAPDDRALTAAGWVWPPVLLALAVWIALRARRSLSAGSGRWAVYAVVVIMIAASLGGLAETVALAADPRTQAMPGTAYDIGGRRLHLDCTGSGSPTVVLQSGQGEMSSTWGLIAPAVAGTTRVCAYDRAGQGWSEDAPQLQDGWAAAADLHALLARAGEHGPYVLVGHSIGGAHAMAFAARYPDDVAGMVELDSSDPYQAAVAPGATDSGAPPPFGALASLSRLGILHLVPAGESDLPEPSAGSADAFAASPRGLRNYRDDFATMPALFTDAQALTTLGSKPLVVLTAASGPEAAHDRMAALSTNSSHRHTDETHAGLLVTETGAEVSVRAIDDVVQAARTATALPQE
ncbi:alpha/beta fold hydrolase [Georgenia yuyongxinii]|uniref:alpha/beta fold hydrolase n=1 Tax=Georgenia yuyongxinii TaxID=2589797 RepID=UPI00163D4353|nr:alpha/beta hydrolase [Georgenia yuyongxinii]